ncbi:GDSL-type esterase/lipase family protein [Lactobacillus sp. YT155]|uniref:SGNH/GDSL hydrolase family protein n=1 Tax=Lactobacillus sp. YT155 TaxID=3060955 RepID=UPI00265D9339|nr:GDSL-type esterase/lipase family protein [Lactobacillus sp. YT155]MDO1604731.1 GDSL-type esterase/lipase family protein [Lactobacillus sp. YT155]
MTKIVLFGDSILAGSFNGKTSDIFTDRIKHNFPDAEVINASIPGHRTSDAITHVDRDVAKLEADAVVVFFGANDVSTNNEMKPGYFTSNLDYIIESIGADKIVLVSPPYIDYKRQQHRSWPRQIQFELAVEHVAKEHDIPYVDIMKEMRATANPNSLLQGDGLHFTDKAYDLLEKELVPKIKNVINRA